MKRKEFLKEIKALSRDDLVTRSRSLAEEAMKLRFRKGNGQLEQSHRLKQVKKELARVNTLLSSGVK